MLELYRSAIRLRPRGDAFAWHESLKGTMIFDRGELTCAVNFDAPGSSCPTASSSWRASRDQDDPAPNTAAWVRKGTT